MNAPCHRPPPRLPALAGLLLGLLTALLLLTLALPLLNPVSWLGRAAPSFWARRISPSLPSIATACSTK